MENISSLEFLFYVFTANISRYLIISGSFFLVFYFLIKKRWQHKKLQAKFPKNKDYFREISYSILTLCVFVSIAFLIFRSPLAVYTLRYNNIAELGWGYWWFSVVAMIFIHDTYFYWTHRAMHHPKLYRFVHLVHHQSQNPSPWAAFAFHPLEAVVEAGIVFVIAFILPFHGTALLAFLIFMTFYNAYGHLGYELYSKRFLRSSLGRWLNTSVAHNQHHEKFNGNYGLYFLFWDRWMGTLREDYDTQCVKVDQK